MKNCKYYEFDGICGSRNNVKELECKSVPLCMCYYKQLQQLRATLDEIEKIVKDICDEECGFKWCKGKKHCGDDDCRYMQIMEKIKQAKEDNKRVLKIIKETSNEL